MTNKTSYITTPIYYANGSPHVGHYLTTTIADSLNRYFSKKLGDNNAFFTTGLDEHGTTVEQAAVKAGYDINNIQNFVDLKAEEWKKAFDDTNIKYDYFVRTTNPQHEKFAQEFIQKMVKAGDVYKNTYTGKYCNGCEKFLTISDLNEQGLCPLHRADQVVEVTEENYFFKLSKYQTKLQELISQDIIKILPEAKKNEVLARIEQGLEDLSISRPKGKVSWGIEFPNDPNQTIYVWVEALINYLSSLEINNKQDFWQNTTHIMAKDINWFHNVIWPAFLLSADYPLYKRSFVHNFFTVNNQKISKSLGNVITPNELVNRYSVDGARYLILSFLPYKNDSDVNWELLTEKYNADLANGLGNAVARVAKLAQNSKQTFNIKVDEENVWEDEIFSPIDEDFRIDLVLQNIWKDISTLDSHINENEPWKIKDENKLHDVLKQEISLILKIGTILEPFLPETSKKIVKQFGASTINATEPLFPRI